jgi:uncharacterized DUF497 family protein
MPLVVAPHAPWVLFRMASHVCLNPIPVGTKRGTQPNFCLPCDPNEYRFYTMPGFEFNPQKSTTNKANHGIDVREVQALWRDQGRLEVPARTEDEPRFLVIGTIGATHWVAVITYRGDRIRIISARRARPGEVCWYESESV